MSSRAKVVGFVAVALLGCARAPISQTSRSAPDGAVAIDAEVMAYLSMARALHHQANLEEDRDPAAAIAALRHLSSAPRPHAGQRVPEVEDVLADTFARVAELDVRQNDLRAAADSIREGLAHAPEPSYFRGHLLEVGGIVEEARAAVLRDAGNARESEVARAHALELLREAVVVQESVVRESLADAGRVDGGK